MALVVWDYCCIHSPVRYSRRDSRATWNLQGKYTIAGISALGGGCYAALHELLLFTCAHLSSRGWCKSWLLLLAFFGSTGNATDMRINKTSRREPLSNDHHRTSL